jgi:hypothetical protein
MRIGEKNMRTGMGRLAVLIFAMGIATGVAAVPNQGSIESDPIDFVDSTPPQYAQVMLVQASQSQQVKSQYERTIGVCTLINNPPNAPKEPWAGSSATSPAAVVALYYQNIEGRVFGYEGARVSVIESPQHGNLQATDDGAYYYFPESGYLGKDRVTFLVEIDGRKFKVVHYVQMMEIVPEYAHEDRQYCPNGFVWKISAINTIKRGQTTFKPEFAMHPENQWGQTRLILSIPAALIS